MNSFIELMRERRSVYNLGNNIKKSKEELNALVLRAVELSPSSFNSQSSRVVILWGNHSHKLWDIAKDELKVLISEEAFKSTSEKLDSFARGSGTILFFEDSRVIDKLQEQFPSYADNSLCGLSNQVVWLNSPYGQH